MGIEDIRFLESGSAIYDSIKVVTTKTIKLENLGENTVTNLRVFLRPASSLGDISEPGDEAPETDYQDVLTWGDRTDSGLEPSGGLKVEYMDGGMITTYFTYSAGSKLSNAIALPDIAPSAILDLDFILEVPAGVSARRLFVDVEFA